MSTLLELNIKNDLYNCQTMNEIEAIIHKYEAQLIDEQDLLDFYSIVDSFKKNINS